MDMTVLADALAPVLRDLVDATTAPLLLRLDALEKRLGDDLPALIELRRDLKEGLAEAIGRLPQEIDGAVRAQVGALPPPKDGKDADAAAIEEAVAVEVAKQIAALPVPTGGKDVDPETIKAMVAAAVSTLPPPRDGRDVEPAEIEAMVAKAVAGLPTPKDGQGVAVDDLRPMVEEVVAAGFAALPPVQAGKDADPETVRVAVAAEVAKAVATLPQQIEAATRLAVDALPKAPTAEELAALVPKPADGKSVSLKDVQPLVDETIAGAFATLRVPTDGKDADPEAVRAMVADEVARQMAELPPPEPGKSVTVDDLRPLVDEAVAGAVAALPKAPTAEDLAALVPAGKDADPEATAAFVATEVQKAVAALPPAAPGRDADPEVMRVAVVAEVERAMAAAPKPENGKDATPEQIAAEVEKVLATWERPKDGASVTLEQIEPVVAAAIDKAMEAHPMPKDGNDGVGLAGAVKDHEGCLVLTLTDGTLVKLGRVDGEPGRPGADGLGFDDLEVIRDGERGFKFVFARGGQVKEFAFTLPVVLDRGVFKEGTEYAPGDAVSFGGSLWIAQRASGDRPGTSDAFRLAVKKGRDGKDGELPAPPKPVKLK